MDGECLLRCQRLQQKMAERGIDGFWVTHNADLLYFAGSMQIGYLFVPVEGEPVYLVRKSVNRAGLEAEVPVEPLGSLRFLGRQLAERVPGLFAKGSPLKFAAAYDVLPVQWFQRLEQAFPGAVWTDGSALIREVRMIKSAQEIERIKHAANVLQEAMEAVLPSLREGVTELDWLAFIEFELRKRGHQGLMRMRGTNQELVTGFLGSGEAMAEPGPFDGPANGRGLGPAIPQSASRKTIDRNEPILMDIGCSVDGYAIDQTRTAVIGKLPQELERAYHISVDILRSVEERLLPGVSCEELYFHALDLAKRAGLEDHFMGFGPDQAKFLGHGIGLEIDEYPVLAKGFKVPLEPGMVIAIEPKFTFPGQGVVGIENSYVIREDGFEKITLFPEEILRIS